MKWLWLLLGIAGLILGARAGKGQIDRLAHWSKRNADNIGLSSAAEQIVDSAKSAADDLHDAATARSQTLLSNAADAVTERLGSATEHAAGAGG
jgi:hypothetical protein